MISLESFGHSFCNTGCIKLTCFFYLRCYLFLFFPVLNQANFSIDSIGLTSSALRARLSFLCNLGIEITV
jgi:hypothetical protein